MKMEEVAGRRSTGGKVGTSGFEEGGEKKRIGPGSTENNCMGVKIIYSSHLRGCSVIVRPTLI